MAPNGHSMIGASGSSVWLNCPAMPSFRASLPVVKPSLPMSKGTAAHALGEQVLNGIGDSAWKHLGEEIVADGRIFVVDEEMAEAVQQYVDEVQSHVVRGALLFVEKRFHLAWLHEELYGTNDAALIVPGLRLIVWDYKNGSGKPVRATRNTQLMEYGVGALGEGNPHGVQEVILKIVQPNLDESRLAMEYREYCLPAKDLIAWSYDVLKPAAERCFEPNPPFVCGDWCSDCQVAAMCKARNGLMLAEAGIGMSDLGDIVVPPASALTVDQLLRIYASADDIRSYLKRVEARIWGEAERQNPEVPYKIAQETEGRNRRWLNEGAVAKTMKHLLGDEAFNQELKSPARMVDALKETAGYKKRDAEALIAPLVSRELKYPKQILVPTSDPRKALDASADMPDLNEDEL
jgi:hypothetical protein